MAKGLKTYRMIDMFCGAGGMALGFSERFGHPFQSVWANDFNKECTETYNRNFGLHCVSGDIVDILANPATIIPKADVVIGGPPCQGFSLLNKNRMGDPRKQLWRPFLEVVEKSGASIFVMENVPQLLNTPEHKEIVETACKMGFAIWNGKLCAADYGVAQTRIRAFIVGCRFIDPNLFFPPRKTHYDPNKSGIQLDLPGDTGGGYLPNCEPWRTVRHAVSDLPRPEGTEIRSVPPPLLICISAVHQPN